MEETFPCRSQGTNYAFHVVAGPPGNSSPPAFGTEVSKLDRVVQHHLAGLFYNNQASIIFQRRFQRAGCPVRVGCSRTKKMVPRWIVCPLVFQHPSSEGHLVSLDFTILMNHESHDSPDKPLPASDKNLSQGLKILSELKTFCLVADLTESSLLVSHLKVHLKMNLSVC